MRKIIAIGGGELRNKTTLEIDSFVAKLAKEHAVGKRANGLFVGTASHDSMPYFNSFRKTYTSEFDIKADCVLTVYGEMNFDKIKEKFLKADLVYIGGGDTLFMLDSWKKSGVYDLVIDAYNRGVVIAGLSAGAIFWFETMYTDSDTSTIDVPYSLKNGIGLLKGTCSPHYNQRKVDFDENLVKNNIDNAFAICDDSAVVFCDEKPIGYLSSGGVAYFLRNNNGKIETFELEKLN